MSLISFSKLEHFLYFRKGRRQEERGAKYKSGLRSKSCSFSLVSIVQSSNRVLLSSQFELNLPFQGHVKEESAPCTFLFFSLPDVITKIIPTTSLLLRNLKKRELFQKSEVLFQLLILLSAYQRISCQSHFQREVARKLLNAELEREEAMLS